MKIAYFDNWTKGIRCFLPVDKVFKQKGIETCLIHVESFTAKNVKEKQVIDGIESFDISFYNTKFIYEALKREKPDVIITLNTTFILDRCLMLACKELNIKTYYLMHGEHNTEGNLEQFIANDIHRNSLINKIPKMWFYLNHHILNFYYSYWKNKNKPYNLSFLFKILFSNFKNPAQERYFPKYGKDFLANKAFLYNEKYTNHYLKLGYLPENIKTVGYPEYDEIFKEIKNDSFDSNEIEKLSLTPNKYAVYIDNAYSDMSLYGWNIEKRNTVLHKIADKLARQDLKLVVKIHPSNTSIDVIDTDHENILVIQKLKSFSALYFFSKFCIIQSSTANNIPLILKKPLVIPTWKPYTQEENILPYHLLYIWNDYEGSINLDFSTTNRDDYINTFFKNTSMSSGELICSEILLDFQ